MRKKRPVDQQYGVSGIWFRGAKSFVDKEGKFLPECAAEMFGHGIGQISRPSGMRGPREMAEFTNTIQRWIIENTRLGIPVMFHEEALHGLATRGATSFPQAIALASTWDCDLVHEFFTATALETRSRGVQQVLSPVLDIARDPGRMVSGAGGRNCRG